MRSLSLCCLVITMPALAFAQDHAHTPGMTHTAGMSMTAVPPVIPTLSGQDAYAAIAEVVRILKADSTTDWSRVDLEALRQHLIDMNAVTLGAEVRATEVADGMRFEVTGEGRTRDAIRRMVSGHAPMLNSLADYTAASTEIPGGAELTVLAKGPDKTRQIAMIRGLGFIGLLTEGEHHARHHLALAQGDAMAHSR